MPDPRLVDPYYFLDIDGSSYESMGKLAADINRSLAKRACVYHLLKESTNRDTNIFDQIVVITDLKAAMPATLRNSSKPPSFYLIVNNFDLLSQDSKELLVAYARMKMANLVAISTKLKCDIFNDYHRVLSDGHEILYSYLHWVSKREDINDEEKLSTIKYVTDFLKLKITQT